MSGWTWVDPGVVLAIHDEQRAEHGGAGGLADPGAFESAMAGPVQIAARGSPDAAALAAAYAFGLVHNPPFVDSNARTAYVVAETFLALNGARLAASDAASVLNFIAFADGDLSELALADWFRANT